jgi:hypothetical protein
MALSLALVPKVLLKPIVANPLTDVKCSEIMLAVARPKLASMIVNRVGTFPSVGEGYVSDVLFVCIWRDPWRVIGNGAGTVLLFA